MPFSKYARQKMLASAGIAGGSFYMALVKAGGTEVSSGNYARVAVTLGAFSEGDGSAVGAITDSGNSSFSGFAIADGTTYVVNATDAVFPQPGTTGAPPNTVNNTFGTVAALAIYDAKTDGNLIASANLISAMQEEIKGLVNFTVKAGEFIAGIGPEED